MKIYHRHCDVADIDTQKYSYHTHTQTDLYLMRRELMDNVKIKQLAINDLWASPNKKSGDEYRSYTIQIDTMLRHLQEQNTPLNWLPFDMLSDQDIAKFIVTFIRRKPKNRLLYNNLNYASLKYNYSDLVVEDESSEYIMQFFKDEFDFDFPKNYNLLNINEGISVIKKLFRLARPGYYKQTLLDIDAIFNNIINQICEEQNLFLRLGLELSVPHYLNNLNTILEIIATESLFSVVICNDFISDKVSVLSRLEQLLDQVHQIIDNKIKKLNNKFKFFHSISRSPKNQISTVSTCYAQYLFRRSRYREQENIFHLLKADIDNATYTAPTQKYTETIQIDTLETLQNYFMEGSQIPNFKDKLENTQKLITLAAQYHEKKFDIHTITNLNNFRLDIHDITYLKIIFRALYTGKTVYRDKQSSTIVKDILSYEMDFNDCYFHYKDTETLVTEILANHSLPSIYFMFLDAKIMREYFREQNMLKEFIIFNQIMIKYRNLILKIYKLFSYNDAYILTSHLCYEFLVPFLCESYSGIKIE